jgi:hypothetical protein
MFGSAESAAGAFIRSQVVPDDLGRATGVLHGEGSVFRCQPFQPADDVSSRPAGLLIILGRGYDDTTVTRSAGTIVTGNGRAAPNGSLPVA